MRAIELYQCEICGIQYKDKNAAEKCEKAHILPKKIVGHKYYKERKYAEYLMVEFEDGSVGKYQRS